MGIFNKEKDKNKIRKTSYKKGVKHEKIVKAKETVSFRKEERLIKNVDKFMVTRFINLNSGLTLEELKEKLKPENRKKISVLEYMIIRAMKRVYVEGDMSKLDAFLDRAIGKVPTKTIHGVEDPYEGKSLEELIEIRKKLVEINRRHADNIIAKPRYVEQTKRLAQGLKQIELPDIEDPTDDDPTNSN